MNNIFSISWQRRFRKRNLHGEVQIDTNMPTPIKGVEYDVLIKYKQVLGKLNVGESFVITKDLNYAIRRIASDCYPEYKVSIRNTGLMDRVFRKG